MMTLHSPLDFPEMPIPAFLATRQAEGWRAAWLEVPDFPAQLRAWRQGCGFTVRAVGMQLSVSHSLLIRLESGDRKKRLPLEMLQGLAVAYHQDPRALLDAAGLRLGCEGKTQPGSDPESDEARLRQLLRHPELRPARFSDDDFNIIPPALYGPLLLWAERVDAHARTGGVPLGMVLGECEP